MTPERWQQILTLVESRFKVLDRYTEALEPGSAEVIEFEAPQGKLQARFVRRPRVLDKKTLYSRRAGGAVSVDYVYSDTDEACHLELLRWDDASNQWVRMNESSLL